MRKILALLLAGISCHASANTMNIDSPFCTTTQGDRGFCIQNQHSETIKGNYAIVNEAFFKDGTSSHWQSPINQLQSGNYIDVSISNDFLKEHQIEMLDYTLLYNNVPIRGCTTKLKASRYPNKMVLKLDYDSHFQPKCSII